MFSLVLLLTIVLALHSEAYGRHRPLPWGQSGFNRGYFGHPKKRSVSPVHSEPLSWTPDLNKSNAPDFHASLEKIDALFDPPTEVEAKRKAKARKNSFVLNQIFLNDKNSKNKRFTRNIDKIERDVHRVTKKLELLKYQLILMNQPPGDNSMNYMMDPSGRSNNVYPEFINPDFDFNQMHDSAYDHDPYDLSQLYREFNGYASQPYPNVLNYEDYDDSYSDPNYDFNPAFVLQSMDTENQGNHPNFDQGTTQGFMPQPTTRPEVNPTSLQYRFQEPEKKAPSLAYMVKTESDKQEDSPEGCENFQ